ncbi:gamma-glutamyltransferase, partial [Staphylococcus aureus]
KLFEHVDLLSMGSRSVDYLHHLLHAMHLAYSERAQFLADDTFHAVPVQTLIADNSFKARSTIIDSNKANIYIELCVLSDCISYI